jgi:predicted flap endonuclease-1-like 5' DNA nuclease
MRTFFRLTLLAFVLGTTSPLLASEYPLESVFFVEAAEVEQLHKIPAATTHQAGAALATRKQRKAMKKKVGLDEARAEELAALFDLMRIKGAGPKMAILLKAAGVTCIVHMAREDSADLLKRVLKANQRLRVSSKIPDERLLKNWILQARKLKPQFRGTPQP